MADLIDADLLHQHIQELLEKERNLVLVRPRAAQVRQGLIHGLVTIRDAAKAGRYKPVSVTPPASHLSRSTDPQTSKEAAKVVSRGKVREEILSLLEKGSLTDQQIIARLGVKASESGVRTRRSELVKAGLVYDTGERRLTDTGRRSIAWGLVWK